MERPHLAHTSPSSISNFCAIPSAIMGLIALSRTDSLSRGDFYPGIRKFKVMFHVPNSQSYIFACFRRIIFKLGKFTNFKLPFPAVPNLSQTKLHLQLQNNKINLKKVYSVYVNNSYVSAFYAVLVRSLY